MAVGSRDRSLSVWMTALQRPLVVIHDLFQDTILDLSWSTDQNILLACSTDGTVACLLFTSAELGTPLSEDDKNSLYQRMYGKSANIHMNEKTGKDMIVEYAELINNDNEKSNHSCSNNKTLAQDICSGGGVTTEISVQNNNLEMLSVTPSTVLPMPIGVLSPKPAIHKQIETRTADGRRRITPMFIPLSQELSESAPELSSSSRSAGLIQLEKSTAIEMNESIPVIADDNSSTVAVPVHKDLVSTVVTVPKRIVEPPEKTQLSSRLTAIAAPIRSKPITMQESASSTVIAETCVQQQKIPPLQHQSPTKFNALSAGKAIPLQGTFARSFGEYRVNVSFFIRSQHII